MQIGDQIEDFTLPITGDGEEFTLSSAAGKFVVLYFYPKDDTPGCTLEGKDFSAMLPAFAAANAVVLGISRDSVASHEKFRAKFDYQHHLLSDGDSLLCDRFDVLREKTYFGKKVRGIARGTFLIAPDGTLAAEWRDIKEVAGHAQAVLDRIHAAA